MVLARGSWCEHLKGAHTHTHAHVSLLNTGSYTELSMIRFVVYSVNICKKVLSVSTRKGTDICEFAQHGFIYKTICDMIYVYL